MAVEIGELEQLQADVLGSSWDPEEARAFEETYEQFRARLFRFCYSKLRDVHEAEDVTQETFARAWRTHLSFSDRQRAYAWLRVVAGNLCTDLLRRRGRCQTAPDIEPGVSSAADDAVLRAGDAQIVRQAMARLNDRHRTALEQRESAGWTYEQMASYSGTTISSIESLLWRARQALKRELTALAGPDGLLAGVPVIGVAVRRFHGGRMRLTGWISQWVMPQVANGAAMVIGSCAIVCVTALGGPADGAASVPAPLPAALAVPAPAPGPPPTVTTTTGAPSAATVAGPAGPAGTSTAAGSTPTGPHRLGLENPVTSTRPDNQRDRSMPLSTGVGPDTVGVDPAGTVNYATKLASDQVAKVLGGHR